MESLRDKGRPTALDYRPVLSNEEISVWNMYAVIGDDVLMSLDAYRRNMELPLDWTFKECLTIVNKLNSKMQKLGKKDD